MNEPSGSQPAGRPLLPVFDVRAHDAGIRVQIEEAVGRVMSSGWFILGPELERFENAFATWLGEGAGEVVGVGSGTDAIRIALTAAGIGAGDTVVTVPNTAVPTVSAITDAGARPVFADVDPDTALIDPDRIAEAIRPDTRAIVPVHLYGRIAPMDEIVAIARKHDLVVIEDAAQAHGAALHDRRAGTWGDYGCFSFFPSKNVGAYGDGGALWVKGPAQARAARHLRNYGQTDRYRHDTVGINSRLDEIQAAILGAKLEHLEMWNQRRRDLALRLDALLEPLCGPGLRLPRSLARATDARHVYHLYVVRVAKRESVRAALQEAGIGSQVHYPVPVHHQESYRYLGYAAGSFPEAEAWCAETLSLPFSPALGENDLSRVADAMGKAIRDVAD